MLIDSNIIIYATKPENGSLRQWIAEKSPAVSAVSYVEVLGYHKLTADDKALLEEFFAAAMVLPITDEVLKEAVRLRQARTMTVGDSIVAGTALANKRNLATRNTKDFTWIPELTVIDPFTELATTS